MPTCSAVDCTNKRGGKTGRSFHSFPLISNPDLAKLWTVNMKRGQWTPTKGSVLCSDHFKDECFERKNSRVTLKAGAIPTLFKEGKEKTVTTSEENALVEEQNMLNMQAVKADHWSYIKPYYKDLSLKYAEPIGMESALDQELESSISFERVPEIVHDQPRKRLESSTCIEKVPELVHDQPSACKRIKPLIPHLESSPCIEKVPELVHDQPSACKRIKTLIPRVESSCIEKVPELVHDQPSACERIEALIPHLESSTCIEKVPELVQDQPSACERIETLIPHLESSTCIEKVPELVHDQPSACKRRKTLVPHELESSTSFEDVPEGVHGQPKNWVLKIEKRICRSFAGRKEEKGEINAEELVSSTSFECVPEVIDGQPKNWVLKIGKTSRSFAGSKEVKEERNAKELESSTSFECVPEVVHDQPKNWELQSSITIEGETEELVDDEPRKMLKTATPRELQSSITIEGVTEEPVDDEARKRIKTVTPHTLKSAASAVVKSMTDLDQTPKSAGSAVVKSTPDLDRNLGHVSKGINMNITTATQTSNEERSELLTREPLQSQQDSSVPTSEIPYFNDKYKLVTDKTTGKVFLLPLSKVPVSQPKVVPSPVQGEPLKGRSILLPQLKQQVPQPKLVQSPAQALQTPRLKQQVPQPKLVLSPAQGKSILLPRLKQQVSQPKPVKSYQQPAQDILKSPAPTQPSEPDSSSSVHASLPPCETIPQPVQKAVASQGIMPNTPSQQRKPYSKPISSKILIKAANEIRNLGKRKRAENNLGGQRAEHQPLGVMQVTSTQDQLGQKTAKNNKNACHTTHEDLFAVVQEDFWEKCSKKGWCFQYSKEKIIFRFIDNCIVKKALFVNRSTGDFEISICGRPLPSTHPFLQYTNRTCLQTIDQLSDLIDDLHKWKPCIGVPDPEFIKAWKSNPVKNVHLCNIRNSLYSDSCTVLVFGLRSRRCVQCARKHKFFSSRHYRWQRCKAESLRNITNTNFKGHKHLPRKELIRRCIETEDKEKLLRYKLQDCQLNYEKLAEEMKMCICGKILKHRVSPEGNELVYLFVKEQLKALSAKSPTSFRWNPTILKFSAYIYNKSPEAYEALRGCGFLNLPRRESLCRNVGRLRKQALFPSTDLDDVALLFDRSDDSDNSQSEDYRDDCENSELGRAIDAIDDHRRDGQESENGDCEQYEENVSDGCVQSKKNTSNRGKWREENARIGSKWREENTRVVCEQNEEHMSDGCEQNKKNMRDDSERNDESTSDWSEQNEENMNDSSEN